jgi:hypothetical protein
MKHNRLEAGPTSLRERLVAHVTQDSRARARNRPDDAVICSPHAIDFPLEWRFSRLRQRVHKGHSKID